MPSRQTSEPTGGAHLQLGGRPPPVPSGGFSQGWCTTHSRSTTWKRSLSASSIRRSDSGSPVAALANSTSGYQAAHERLRGAGAEVVGTPPRNTNSPASDQRSSDHEGELDVHQDCRARILILSSELAEANQAFKNLQRDQEKLLRRMTCESEHLRLTVQRHSESEQETLTEQTEVRRLRREMLCMRKEQEQHAMWESEQEQTARSLRSSLQSSEERERDLQTALDAEMMSARAAAERLQGALHVSDECEQSTLEALERAREKDLQFAELREQVKALSVKCTAKDEALEERKCEFNELNQLYGASEASEDALRSELEKYQNRIDEELKAALADMQASQEQSMERRVSEFCSERDEARKQTMLVRTAEGTMRTLKNATEKKLKASEAAHSESLAMQRTGEQEMQEMQTRNAKTEKRKDAEVKMYKEQLDQSKTEITELYDALVRASENSRTDKRKSTKGQALK